ncbi:TolC family protein [candidate division KSB1 bacterium]|nr:TolC family protein [candidate division KSB1 bacterium]
MKRIQAIVCLFCFSVFAAPGIAQEIETTIQTLTLQQAVERALANYPALQIQQYSIEQAQGLKTTAGLFPNPVITFYREDLSLNGQDAGETTVYAGLPLNFLWSRWSKVAAASAQVDAEQMMLADVRRLIKFEVQKAFVETHFAVQNYQAWQKAANVFRQAAEASRFRFADGDMAGYEHQRIAVEYLRYQKAEAEAKVLLNNSRRQLAFILDPDQSETLIKTSAVFPSHLPEISQEKLLAQSLETRPDLQAAGATLRGKQAALTANKWGRLPRIVASIGYKKQVDDFKGSVVQINFGFPLFNRNQGKVHSASAALSQQTLATELLEKRVAMEVRQAYETYQLYLRLVEQFLAENVQPTEQLLEVAQFSYSEGEMSLLELLDGVRAYSESFHARNDLLLKYQLSIFELEKAVATSITQK